MKPKPHIHGAGRLFTASNIVTVAGKALGRIKRGERLTLAQVGEVMAGRSEDRASAYINGTADMGLVPFLFAARQWRERFLDPILALIGMRAVDIDATCDSDAASGRRAASAIARLLAKLNAALEDDGEVDEAELAGMEAELNDALGCVSAKLARLRRAQLAVVAA